MRERDLHLLDLVDLGAELADDAGGGSPSWGFTAGLEGLRGCRRRRCRRPGRPHGRPSGWLLQNPPISGIRGRTTIPVQVDGVVDHVLAVAAQPGEAGAGVRRAWRDRGGRRRPPTGGRTGCPCFPGCARRGSRSGFPRRPALASIVSSDDHAVVEMQRPDPGSTSIDIPIQPSIAETVGEDLLANEGHPVVDHGRDPPWISVVRTYRRDSFCARGSVPAAPPTNHVPPVRDARQATHLHPRRAARVV